MLILHAVKRSLVRHTPSRIACYWGRFFEEHSGVGICIGRPGGKGFARDSLNCQGTFYAQDHQRELRELVAKADVIHCHDDAYPTMLIRNKEIGDKALVYHAHIGDIPRRLFRTGRFKYNPNVKHVCITNGYGRHFDAESKRARVRWGRLPDVLDLTHPLFRTEERPPVEEGLKVVFTYSNNREPGRKINAKGPHSTHRALGEKIPGISWQLVTGVPFERSMQLKRSAHVVLDEIFSPYTHLSSLEGAAVGACVVTSYDDYTRNELCDFLGAPRESYPFVNCTADTIRQVLTRLRDNPDEVKERGEAGYHWMRKWYEPKRVLERFLELYRC